MNAFTINLNKNKIKPLYEQLYLYIAGEIRTGNLKSGEKLPSKKLLSSHLGISANTVETAYSMLVQEGYAEAKPRSGFYVCDIGSVLPSNSSTASSLPAQKRAYKYDFKTNAVDFMSFPYSTWAKLSKHVLYDCPELLSAGDAQGDFALRQAISKYLHEFRGVYCSPEQVIIGAGMEYLLMLLCEALNKEMIFALEDPGYHKTDTILKNSGRKVNYIPLDEEGMLLCELKKSSSSIAYITPSHQFPTGCIMPVGRRIELLKWAAQRPERYIIEDDYNSEFHYGIKPIPSIQGLDKNHKVIYMSTFSRVLAPSIRIAYMVLPYPLLRVFQSRFSHYSSTVSRFEQHTLAQFISGGYFSRHINRVKNIYKKRKDSVLSLLKLPPYKDRLTVTGGKAGLHLLLTVKDIDKTILHERMEKHDIRISFLSDYHFNKKQGADKTLVLGYAGLETSEIKMALELLFGE